MVGKDTEARNMNKIEYENILQVIDALSADEMLRLRQEIDHRLAASTAPREAAMTPDQRDDQATQRRLFEAGLLGEIKPPREPTGVAERFTPIAIGGEPLSETITRDRR